MRISIMEFIAQFLSLWICRDLYFESEIYQRRTVVPASYALFDDTAVFYERERWIVAGLSRRPSFGFRDADPCGLQRLTMPRHRLELLSPECVTAQHNRAPTTGIDVHIAALSAIVKENYDGLPTADLHRITIGRTVVLVVGLLWGYLDGRGDLAAAMQILLDFLRQHADLPSHVLSFHPHRENSSTFTSQGSALPPVRSPPSYLVGVHPTNPPPLPSDRLITSKDHASIQITIADVDPETGVALKSGGTTIALCGQVRSQGEADDSINRIATKAGGACSAASISVQWGVGVLTSTFPCSDNQPSATSGHTRSKSKTTHYLCETPSLCFIGRDGVFGRKEKRSGPSLGLESDQLGL
jgi:hypothetical protein